VKLALCLDGLPADELPAIAAEAERRGFRTVLAAETTGADPFVACAAMSAATRSILVGTGIAGIHGRSAASTAMAAASLATLSGGRFVLGLGLQSKRLVEGSHGAVHGGLRAMRETIHVVRRLLAGETVAFRGETVRVDGHRLGFPPRGPVPIHVGALGPRMLELAGETADGLLGWFCSRPFLDRVVRPRLDAGARRIGRSLDEFDLTWMLPVLVSEDPGARDLLRPYVATYLTAGWPSYDRVAEVSGFGQAAADLRRRLQHARHFDEVASAVSDEMLDAFALCGPPSEVRARIERLRETGVTTLGLFPIPPGQFYPLFPGHFPVSLPVPPADLDGLRRNVAAILGGALA
jgi:alkanesulfonate monooxygenase SsuD/methylene tetrahydromethanopterin reductase-like flavin-dependent oxidoreductase (luciferase family)